MELPGSSLNILTVYAREHTFSFENSASSKPPPTIGYHFYEPSGDASELWAKMELAERFHGGLVSKLEIEPRFTNMLMCYFYYFYFNHCLFDM
ncbi:hypothetical protein H8959_002987 [Pygathrix nigripes]